MYFPSEDASVSHLYPCLLIFLDNGTSFPIQDKKFASGKYHDIYLELNHIKQRSEREIEHLKEHLRLAMAALEEKEMLHNNIGIKDTFALKTHVV